MYSQNFVFTPVLPLGLLRAACGGNGPTGLGIQSTCSKVLEVSPVCDFPSVTVCWMRLPYLLFVLPLGVEFRFILRRPCGSGSSASSLSLPDRPALVSEGKNGAAGAPVRPGGVLLHGGSDHIGAPGMEI